MTQRETVRHWIDAAAHITVLTGAGVSAESGEPTFRDAQTGRWAQFNPEPAEHDQLADACLREPAARCLPFLLESP